MTSIPDLLRERFDRALVAAFGEAFAGKDPLIAATNNPKFGDYQSNVAMALKKAIGQPPREIATAIRDNLELSDTCEPPEIAGPGFINLRLKPAYLEKELQKLRESDRLNVAKNPKPQRAIVDFSSPNIAKEMHVGHLRSTIIGDAIARLLEFRGHDVLRLNHVGDWGTQFGMLICYLREKYPEALTTADAIDLGDLVQLYQAAKQRFKEDEAFQENARKQVTALQSGAEDARRAWQLLCKQSRKEFEEIYERLDIAIAERGESFYNPFLPDLVDFLRESGLLEEDAGAQCVFLEGYQNKEGKPQPLIVQKSDGGYNYATTDLAALRYRAEKDKADRIIYVTDAGQATHFAQVFQVARRSRLIPETVEIVHVPFGLVLGKDGKRIRTSAGETIRLKDLLDEAVNRARADLEQRIAEEGREETKAFVDSVARSVGIGAVKYADLSQNRASNYVFSYDNMLALQGNTAPYMMYAYVRVQGIARKGEIDFEAIATDRAPILLQEATELAIAKHILQFEEIIAAVEIDLLPNRLCQYLFELSQKFNQFYDRCPVLSAEEPLRTSRLSLCDLTARTLKCGLSLLGIPVLERM